MKPLAIYLVTSDETLRTKVGVSANPTIRLGTMQTGSPEHLSLVWHTVFMDANLARAVESEVHAALAEWHLHGEWYDRACHQCADLVDACLSERGLQ